MFGWLKPKSPLDDQARAWVDQRFQWLRQTFGDEPFNRPVVTPTDEFFPGHYRDSQEDAERLFDRVCDYMHVDRSRLELVFYRDDAADDVASGFDPSLQREYAIGAFDQGESSIRIWLEETRLDEADSVVATLSHELGHVHLLADGHCDPSVEDHEPLTDLLTVFFGLGIFSANSAVRETSWSFGGWSGWSATRQGYLSMPEYAYALAVYADARGEERPDWSRHLRKNVRTLMMVELDSIRSGSNESGHSGMESPGSCATGSEAASDYSFALELDVVDADIEMDLDLDEADQLFSVGVLLMQQSDFEGALNAFADATRIQPDDPEILEHHGRVLSALGRFDEAVEVYSHALEIDSEMLEARKGRAMAYAWLRNFSEAAADAELGRKIDDGDATVDFILGAARFGLGDDRGALKSLNNSLRNSPNHGLFFFSRSLVHAALGNETDAEKDRLKAISVEPGFEREETCERTLFAVIAGN